MLGCSVLVLVGKDEEARGRGYHSLYTDKDVSRSAAGEGGGKERYA